MRHADAFGIADEDKTHLCGCKEYFYKKADDFPTESILVRVSSCGFTQKIKHPNRWRST